MSFYASVLFLSYTSLTATTTLLPHITKSSHLVYFLCFSFPPCYSSSIYHQIQRQCRSNNLRFHIQSFESPKRTRHNREMSNFCIIYLFCFQTLSDFSDQLLLNQTSSPATTPAPSPDSHEQPLETGAIIVIATIVSITLLNIIRELLQVGQ